MSSLPRSTLLLRSTLLACAAFIAAPFAHAAEGPSLPDWQTTTHPSASAPAASPLTYPDAESFAERRAQLVTAVARNNLGQWRQGYFTANDPGKYLPNAAIARLLLDPQDADVRKFMNDGRSRAELYHFAGLNWGRFLPGFGFALTAETKAALAANAAKYSAYLDLSGTENHRVMALAAGAVLADYLDTPRLAMRDIATARKQAKEKLRAYVRGLYAAGQGEWDSPTYVMFDLHSMLNIYDFSPDPELRQIAAAALDFYAAAYALKYRDGLHAGPTQRGYYDRPYTSIADQTGWLWWGGSLAPDPAGLRRWYYTMHPATSSWRPNAVLTRIARKQLPGLPVTMRNTKPDYWFGHDVYPTRGAYPETLHLSPGFTLGSIDRGFGSQITRIHLVATRDSGGPLALTGGHPRKSDHKGNKLAELTHKDGGGRYDQSAQFGPLYLCLSRIPADEPADHTFVSLPRDTQPVLLDGRWIFPMGDAWGGVIPLTAASAVSADGSRLEITGRPSGFALVAAERSAHPDSAAFSAWLTRSYKVDTSAFSRELAVAVTLPDGSTRAVRHDAEGSLAAVTPPLAPNDTVYSGPFVHLADGVLSVADGRDGYRVDFTGDLPVYSDLPASSPAR